MRCGRISYTNVLPLYAAFDARAVDFPGSLHAGVPAALNRMLRSGELHCSPLSSVFYAQHWEQFSLFADLCVAADRRAHSVYCVWSNPLSELAGQTVTVTPESATARALLDVICRTWYGFAPEFAESGDAFAAYAMDGRPCLLIGDKAIDAALNTPPQHLHDLGAVWHEKTGQPMVFAVWAVRNDFRAAQPQAVAAASAAFARALAWSAENHERVVAQAQAQSPRAAGFYDAYYRDLGFVLDERRRAGLRAFFQAAAQCGVLAVAPQFAPAEQVGVNV